MLIGVRRNIAELCIKKLEQRLESYERFGYPVTLGMKGLAELNIKEDIQSKIKAIKHIINRRGDDSLKDIDPFCESEIDLEAQKKEAEKQFNKDYQKSKAKYYSVREKHIDGKRVGGSAKKRVSRIKHASHKKNSHKKNSHKKHSHKKHSHKKRVSRKKRVSHKKRSG